MLFPAVSLPVQPCVGGNPAPQLYLPLFPEHKPLALFLIRVAPPVQLWGILPGAQKLPARGKDKSKHPKQCIVSLPAGWRLPKLQN